MVIRYSKSIQIKHLKKAPDKRIRQKLSKTGSFLD